MGSKYTDAQKAATMKYITEKTDDIRIRTARGTKERWQQAAKAAGYQSMTQFVISAVEDKINSK